MQRTDCSWEPTGLTELFSLSESFLEGTYSWSLWKKRTLGWRCCPYTLPTLVWPMAPVSSPESLGMTPKQWASQKEPPVLLGFWPQLSLSPSPLNRRTAVMAQMMKCLFIFETFRASHCLSMFVILSRRPLTPSVCDSLTSSWLIFVSSPATLDLSPLGLSLARKVQMLLSPLIRKLTCTVLRHLVGFLCWLVSVGQA